MLPTPEMKKNLAYMSQRWPGSQASEERDHMYREPLLAQTDEEKKRIFNSGGAGAYAKPREYVQILAALLNNGTHKKTGKQILKPETVEAMYVAPEGGRRRAVTRNLSLQWSIIHDIR